MLQLILAVVFILQQFLSSYIGAYGFSDAIYVHSWLNKGCRRLSSQWLLHGDREGVDWNADKVAIVIISQQCKSTLLWIIMTPDLQSDPSYACQLNYNSNNVPLITYIHAYYGIIEAICPLLMAPLVIYSHLTASYIHEWCVYLKSKVLYWKHVICLHFCVVFHLSVCLTIQYIDSYFS